MDKTEIGPFDQTWFANLQGYNIEKIRPYAAWDVVAEKWIVSPPHLPHWSINDLPEEVRKVLRATDTLARDVLKLPEPERTQQGAALFDAWHSDRSRAFGPNGEGWWDIANLREKWLDQAGLWAQIVDCKHRFNQGLGAADPSWSNDPLAKTAALTPERLDEIGRKEHPNVDHYRSGGMGHLEGDESKSVVGFVPTQMLYGYEGNETHNRERVHEIRDDIRSGRGITNPTMMVYDHKNRWAYLGEGNHRLEGATEAGARTVPLRFVRGDASHQKENGIGAPMHLDSPWKDHHSGEDYIPTDIHPYHFLKGLDREATLKTALPWFDDESVRRPRPKSVRKAGFAGFVADKLWSRDHVDGPYARGHADDVPDYEDEHLSHFVRAHSSWASTWDRHGEIKDVDLKQPIYATQSHVSQYHIDRYRKNPHAIPWAMRDDPDPVHTDEYPGHYRPLFVTHEGRMHAIEGHHRVAADLQDDEPSISGWHYDLDKHPVVENHNGDGCPTCRLHASQSNVEPRTAADGHHDIPNLVESIRGALTDDLLKPEWRNREDRKPTSGHCYAASEAAYHLLGGKDAGWTPMNVKHEGDSHWFLRGPQGETVDPTHDQFSTPVPYHKAVGRGFLTREPSKRAKTIMDRVQGPVEPRTALRGTSLWGKGLDALFRPDEDGPPSMAPSPFPQASRRKDRKDYDESVVARSITHPEEFPVEEVDPRELRGRQPNVLRHHVKRYVEGESSTSDSRLGNDMPRVYHREDGQKIILSGHHRAAAALLKGEKLSAILIRGPFGPSRS